MSIHNLQRYLETSVPGACVPVDLLKIAESINSYSDCFCNSERRTHGRAQTDRLFSRTQPLGSRMARRIRRRPSNAFFAGGLDRISLLEMQQEMEPWRYSPRGWIMARSNRFFGPGFYGGRDGMRVGSSTQSRRSSGGRGREYFLDDFCEDQFYTGIPPLLPWQATGVKFAGELHSEPFHPDPKYSGCYPSEWQSDQFFNPNNQLPTHRERQDTYIEPSFPDACQTDTYYSIPTYHQSPHDFWYSEQCAREYSAYSNNQQFSRNHFCGPPVIPDYESLSGYGSPKYGSPQYGSLQFGGGGSDDSLWFEGTAGSPLPTASFSDCSPCGVGDAQQQFSLVLDAEGCLDRLYGGFYSDWVCGGQWCRMLEFLTTLFGATRQHHLHLSTFLNGCLEPQRMGQWVMNQREARTNINSVLRHVSLQGSPPPKVWWVPPTGLHTALRLALRHLNVDMVVSMDDHHQEVIGFCRENRYDGVLAADADYIVFDPPRYFSSQHLKLTYKGSLETQEFLLSEVCRGLSVPRDRLCLLAALLPNFLLTETDLRAFHEGLLLLAGGGGTAGGAVNPEDVIRGVSNFICLRCCGGAASLTHGLPALAAQIFGSESDARAAKMCASVQYFLNGTQEGFLRYQHSSSSLTRSKCDLTILRRSSAPASSLPSCRKLSCTSAESHSKDWPASLGQELLKETVSSSVPTLVVTYEGSSPPSRSLAQSSDFSLTSASDEASLNASIGRSPTPTASISRVSASSAVHPATSTASSKASSSVPHAGASAMSFLSSTSPKPRTRRHNSVPLLRNIPIICEMVEEDTYTNGNGDDKQTPGLLHDVRITSSGTEESGTEIPTCTGAGVRTPEVKSDYVSLFCGSNKGMNVIGKRLTCPLIKINDSVMHDSPVSSHSITTAMSVSSVYVPQIVIEVSEAPDEELAAATSGTSIENSRDIPSIDITTADDDTDVEVDLELEGKETETVIQYATLACSEAVEPVEEKSSYVTDETACVLLLEERKCNTCRKQKREGSPRGCWCSSGTVSSTEELERALGSTLGKAGHSDSKGVVFDTRTKDGCRDCNTAGGTSDKKEISFIGSQNSISRLLDSCSEIKRQNDPSLLSISNNDPAYECDDEGEVLNDANNEKKSPRRRRKVGHGKIEHGYNASLNGAEPARICKTQDCSEKQDCLELRGNLKTSELDEGKSSPDVSFFTKSTETVCNETSVGGDQCGKNSSDASSVPSIFTTVCGVFEHGIPAPQTSRELSLQSTLYSSDANFVDATSVAVTASPVPSFKIECADDFHSSQDSGIPCSKLSVPSLPSRKTSDESTFSSRRTSASSSVANELMALQSAADDATTTSYGQYAGGGGSNASSRRTSNASVSGELSSPSLSYAPPVPPHDYSVAGSPNVSRRVSSSSLCGGEGGGALDHDSGGGCLSTASGSPGASLLLSSSSSSSNSSAASPYRLTPDVCWLAQHCRTNSPDSGTSETSDTLAGYSLSVRPRRASSSMSPSPTSPTPPSPLPHSERSLTPPTGCILRRSSDGCHPTTAGSVSSGIDSCCAGVADATRVSAATAAGGADVMGLGCAGNGIAAGTYDTNRPSHSALPSLLESAEDSTLHDAFSAPAAAAGTTPADECALDAVVLPPVAHEILRTASERHQKGLMHPWIYQLLTHGEIKLPPYLEQEVDPGYATFADLYRPVRQSVYAVLFNLHHLSYAARRGANPAGAWQCKAMFWDGERSHGPELLPFREALEQHHRNDLDQGNVYARGDQAAKRKTDIGGSVRDDKMANVSTREGLPTTCPKENLRPAASLLVTEDVEQRAEFKNEETLQLAIGEPSPASALHATADPAAAPALVPAPAPTLVTAPAPTLVPAPALVPAPTLVPLTTALTGSVDDHICCAASVPASCTVSSLTTCASQIVPAAAATPPASGGGGDTAVETADNVSTSATAAGVVATAAAPTASAPMEAAEEDAGRTPAVLIREWVYVPPNNVYRRPVLTPAVPLSWPAPTVSRLWFGCSKDDSKRRMRAFLSCLRSDTSLMLQPSCVPQRLVVMATVLRYLVSGGGSGGVGSGGEATSSVLSRQELDAFLVTAFSTALLQVDFLQDLQLPQLSCRGVQVAALFMAGVEAAVLANDACGGSLPWWLLGPWRYFDGKLFHYTLLRANSCASLLELCDNDIELVSKVENCRRAILENLNVTFPKVTPHDYPHPLHPLHPSLSNTCPPQQPPHSQQQQQQSHCSSQFSGRSVGVGSSQSQHALHLNELSFRVGRSQSQLMLQLNRRNHLQSGVRNAKHSGCSPMVFTAFPSSDFIPTIRTQHSVVENCENVNTCPSDGEVHKNLTTVNSIKCRKKKPSVSVKSNYIVAGVHKTEPAPILKRSKALASNALLMNRGDKGRDRDDKQSALDTKVLQCAHEDKSEDDTPALMPTRSNADHPGEVKESGGVMKSVETQLSLDNFNANAVDCKSTEDTSTDALNVIFPAENEFCGNIEDDVSTVKIELSSDTGCNFGDCASEVGVNIVSGRIDDCNEITVKHSVTDFSKESKTGEGVKSECKKVIKQVRFSADNADVVRGIQYRNAINSEETSKTGTEICHLVLDENENYVSVNAVQGRTVIEVFANPIQHEEKEVPTAGVPLQKQAVVTTRTLSVKKHKIREKMNRNKTNQRSIGVDPRPFSLLKYPASLQTYQMYSGLSLEELQRRFDKKIYPNIVSHRFENTACTARRMCNRDVAAASVGVGDAVAGLPRIQRLPPSMNNQRWQKRLQGSLHRNNGINYGKPKTPNRDVAVFLNPHEPTQFDTNEYYSGKYDYLRHHPRDYCCFSYDRAPSASFRNSARDSYNESGCFSSCRQEDVYGTPDSKGYTKEFSYECCFKGLDYYDFERRDSVAADSAPSRGGYRGAVKGVRKVWSSENTSSSCHPHRGYRNSSLLLSNSNNNGFNESSIIGHTCYGDTRALGEGKQRTDRILPAPALMDLWNFSSSRENIPEAERHGEHCGIQLFTSKKSVAESDYSRVSRTKNDCHSSFNGIDTHPHLHVVNPWRSDKVRKRSWKLPHGFGRGTSLLS